MITVTATRGFVRSKGYRAKAVATKLLARIASLCVIAVSLAPGHTAYGQQNSLANPAASPSMRDEWVSQVLQKFARYGSRPTQIIFDGDSITNRWETTGRDTWSKYGGTAADFGIEGDRTENLLWRLSKGQLDGLNPKIVVLMVGTNNSGRDSANQIVEGIRLILNEYQRQCPNAHIILMGVFPRGHASDDPLRIKVNAVNKQLADADFGSRVSFVDISPKLLSADGTISPELMPDFVHPGPAGYVIWANAIQPLIDKYTSNVASNSARAVTSTPMSVSFSSKSTNAPKSASAAGKTAVITFSGLFSDPSSTVQQGPIPDTYQPLLTSFRQTKPIDGANLDTSVTWSGALASNNSLNGGVHDHTGDTPDDAKRGGVVMFSTSPFSMTFSKPVQISSLFWTYYGVAPPDATQGSLAVYTSASDSEPAKQIPLMYSERAGYVWKADSSFAGMSVTKIAFTPGRLPSGKYLALNIDDITVTTDSAKP